MIARLLISSSLEVRIGGIDKILAEFGFKKNHPDLSYLDSSQKLGIEQARQIKDFFSLKPYSAKGRIIVLEDASKLTDEAQNALLKILEELPEHGLFILCANSDANFLPTILSRCQIIRLPDVSSYSTPGVYKDVEKLLEATIEERFEYIEKLKDREEFLKSMVSFFHQKLSEPDTHERSHLAKLKKYLDELLQAEEWQKQNVNLRAILEYLMLVMPH